MINFSLTDGIYKVKLACKGGIYLGPDEQKIIQQAKQGDSDALETIFRHHLDSAIRLAYLITRNWATAEDAVQEAFIQAFSSLNGFQDDRPFQPWFTKIVVNKAKRTQDRLDRGHLPYELEEVNPHQIFIPEAQALEKESLDSLFKAINELDDNHRLPLILKYLTGLSEAETAQVLNLSVSTVKSRLYVARQRLKKEINEGEGRGKNEF